MGRKTVACFPGRPRVISRPRPGRPTPPPRNPWEGDYEVQTPDLKKAHAKEHDGQLPRGYRKLKGTVDKNRKGFGFLAPEDGGPDVFAHYSAITTSGYRTLEENQKVQFEVTQGPKGPQASNITPL